MYTFQDFETQKTNIGFLLTVINDHKSSQIYRDALDADEYDARRNVEIMRLQKFIYNEMGGKTVDKISPNNKLCSGFFPQFITQLNQYLLSNGAEFTKQDTKAKLGERFDTDLQQIGRYALLHGKAFGYYTEKKLYAFPITQFVPLYDEYTGALRAGIRFWQVGDNKPLNVTLFEEDGFTSYVFEDGVGVETQPKQKYIVKTATSKAYGTEITGYENYSTLPIKQLKGNPQGLSELIGIRGQIDAYDRIKSGFANDFDENCLIYWIIKNGGGMNDEELKNFRRRVFYTGVAVGDSDSVPELQTKDIPYQARMSYLDKLAEDLYRDFGAVNTYLLSGSNMVTAQIRAAYSSLDAKASLYEYEVISFVQDVLELIGVTDTPKFKRSGIQNDMEETQRVLMLAPYLDSETLLSKFPGIQTEEVPEIVRRKELESGEKYSSVLTDSTESDIM